MHISPYSPLPKARSAVQIRECALHSASDQGGSDGLWSVRLRLRARAIARKLGLDPWRVMPPKFGSERRRAYRVR